MKYMAILKTSQTVLDITNRSGKLTFDCYITILQNIRRYEQ